MRLHAPVPHEHQPHLGLPPRQGLAGGGLASNMQGYTQGNAAAGSQPMNGQGAYSSNLTGAGKSAGSNSFGSWGQPAGGAPGAPGAPGAGMAPPAGMGNLAFSAAAPPAAQPAPPDPGPQSVGGSAGSLGGSGGGGEGLVANPGYSSAYSGSGSNAELGGGSSSGGMAAFRSGGIVRKGYDLGGYTDSGSGATLNWGDVADSVSSTYQNAMSNAISGGTQVAGNIPATPFRESPDTPPIKQMPVPANPFGKRTSDAGGSVGTSLASAGGADSSVDTSKQGAAQGGPIHKMPTSPDPTIMPADPRGGESYAYLGTDPSEIAGQAPEGAAKGGPIEGLARGGMVRRRRGGSRGGGRGMKPKKGGGGDAAAMKNLQHMTDSANKQLANIPNYAGQGGDDSGPVNQAQSGVPPPQIGGGAQQPVPQPTPALTPAPTPAPAPDQTSDAGPGGPGMASVPDMAQPDDGMGIAAAKGGIIPPGPAGAGVRPQKPTGNAGRPNWQDADPAGTSKEKNYYQDVSSRQATSPARGTAFSQPGPDGGQRGQEWYGKGPSPYGGGLKRRTRV